MIFNNHAIIRTHVRIIPQQLIYKKQIRMDRWKFWPNQTQKHLKHFDYSDWPQKRKIRKKKKKGRNELEERCIDDTYLKEMFWRNAPDWASFGRHSATAMQHSKQQQPLTVIDTRTHRRENRAQLIISFSKKLPQVLR